MKVYEHPEYKALLAGILAEPANDLRRLVTADWLEEHGEEARAELIRLQCDPQLAKPCSQTTYPIPDMPDIGISCLDYITSRDKPQERWCPPCKMRHRVMQIIEADDTETNRHVIRPFAGNGWTAYSVHQWERGFVVEWRGPLAAWCGGECGECGGRGQAVAQPERLRGTTLVVFSTCSKCHGTGHVPGIGPQLVREYPIERVTFTDQRVVLDGLIIPDPLWTLIGGDLGGGPQFLVEFGKRNPDVGSAHHPELAREATSEAAIKWAVAEAEKA